MRQAGGAAAQQFGQKVVQDVRGLTHVCAAKNLQQRCDPRLVPVQHPVLCGHSAGQLLLVADKQPLQEVTGIRSQALLTHQAQQARRQLGLDVQQVACPVKLHEAAQRAVLAPHVPLQSQQALSELRDVRVIVWVEKGGSVGILMKEEEVAKQGAGLMANSIQRVFPMRVDVFQQAAL